MEAGIRSGGPQGGGEGAGGEFVRQVSSPWQDTVRAVENQEKDPLGALSNLAGGRFLATAYSRFGNPIAKEPAASYPERRRCAS